MDNFESWGGGLWNIVISASGACNWEEKLDVRRVGAKTDAALEAAVITTSNLDDMSALQKDSKMIQQIWHQCVWVTKDPTLTDFQNIMAPV